MASTITVALLAALAVLAVILTVRTVNYSKGQPPVAECKPTDADFIPLTDVRRQHFVQALQFKTISYTETDYEREELRKFGMFIEKEFPNIHKLSPFVEWERVNNYSLLYHIKGSNPQLKPYLLMSHLDVVPATNLDVWEAPPFSGDIVNGFVYGRGALDVKHCVMGILEALEYLLSKGEQPVRSFYIAFGHDEEVSGNDGARMLAETLRRKGVTEFEFISDEGLPVTIGIVSGVTQPVASIGVSEKGQAIIKLTVKGETGHSSMPPRESTIGILSQAIARLEANPPPSMLGYGVETDTFRQLAPQMSVAQRVIVANIWLFRPLMSWFMSRNPATRSMIKTVTSVTMFNAGLKANVIAPKAEAIVNHRIHSAQSVNEILEYDRSVIADSRVEIEVLTSFEPHPMSGYGDEDFGYQALKTSVRQIWPQSVVVPGLLIGNTDTKHFLNFSKNVYRFCPTYMFPDDPPRFHGNNERLSLKNYEQVINFYYHLMKNADQAGVQPVHQSHGEL